ncbi:MAG: hypothetical protein Q8R78_04320 [Candidatus Omnitrophota bacterium]|nr:hypothetical protein [Candidatus Omnitrophota bacterium]
MAETTLKTFEVTIDGKTPLLLHRFTDAAQMAATDGTRTSAAAGDRGTPMEQAEASLYKDESGRLIMPGPNLFRCLIEAGKFFKAGKSKITTQKTSMIPACLSVVDIVIPIQHKEPWTVDARPVRIPSTGGRIIRYRPCFHDWSMSFELELDTSMINEKLLRSIVDAAGSRIGLGDFRPDTKGPFGKFVVTKWS